MKLVVMMARASFLSTLYVLRKCNLANFCRAYGLLADQQGQVLRVAEMARGAVLSVKGLRMKVDSGVDKCANAKLIRKALYARTTGHVEMLMRLPWRPTSYRWIASEAFMRGARNSLTSHYLLAYQFLLLMILLMLLLLLQLMQMII